LLPNDPVLLAARTPNVGAHTCLPARGLTDVVATGEDATVLAITVGVGAAAALVAK
jgi:hypothetical protein